jgi:hypothetical protein
MDSISPHWVCKPCNVEVFVEDGYFCCECYMVHVCDVESGFFDIPDFWVDKDGEYENAS